MSFPNQPQMQPPPSLVHGAQPSQQQQLASPTGINSFTTNGQTNKYHPPPPATNGMLQNTELKHQQQFNQQYAALKKDQHQLYTNGIDSSRNASPLTQPISSAYLPPAPTQQQQLPRPNVYGGPAMNSAKQTFPNPKQLIQPQPPQSQPSSMPVSSATNSILSSQPMTNNFYQAPPTNAKIGSNLSSTAPPMAKPTPNLANVDRITSNLQNVHLNNGNSITSPTFATSKQYQQQFVSPPQPIANKQIDGNPTFVSQSQPLPTQMANSTVQSASLQNSVPFRQMPVGQPPMQQQQYNGVPPPIQSNQMPPNSFAPPAFPVTNQYQTVSANSTIGKRPMYPPQAHQQQLSHSNQSQQPPMPQSYPAAMPPNPQYSQQQQMPQQIQQQQNYSNNIVQQGYNSMWGQNTIDLMQQRHILPTFPVEPPKISLEHQFYESVNCSPNIFRCTLTKIPESNSLLQKSRLPLGILIHPFRDLNNLPVIQCSTIVRCRSCRTYINPFVYFVDSKKWKCNLCFRINELPDEFQYDPVSKSYGDVTRRPEVKSSTLEFIAPSEYMLRPPQPAIYLFLLDVSMIAQQSGYLRCVCESLAEHLESMPGDARTQIGFVAFNSAVHFYSLAEGFNQPHEITVVDIDDPFLPFPDNLLINLNECKELIKDLLLQLPTRFAQSHDTNSALGAALQVAFKLMQQTGGRVTVFQTCLPNIGPGALQSRENPNERSAKDIHHLGPATDFYKRQALECSGQQIAVDLFLMNSQYSDLATISGISKFSGGCIHHFPLFNAAKPQQVDTFRRCFERYLTRKIGFESVMRIRCTRGLAIHTFHGNFFVRSTDLLSLPNVNPDAGYGMQISYEENLGESKTVCFQAALLYTSSKGERRIRVHTLCLPITNCLSDVIYSADVQAIIGLISKMAVDRSLQSSITDARDAFINASCDIFSAFHLAQNIKSLSSQLISPTNLKLLPLYMLALLKHTAFRTGTSTRLDDRVFAMCELKTLPLDQLVRFIYPDLYHLDCLFSENNNESNSDNPNERPEPPLLQLSAEFLKSRSIFLMDCGTTILILVGSNVPTTILQNVFGVQSTNEIPDLCFELPNTGTADCENLHSFLESINVEKPYTPPIQIIRDNSPYRSMFIEKLVDDRSESSLSYYEFLQHLRTQVK